MASTTIDTETELSAVNAILGAIGQSPVTVISGNANPEVSFIYNLLRDANVDVQSEGWHFNTEEGVTYYKDANTNKIAIGNDILKMDVHDGWVDRRYDVVRRGGFLYDKNDHTDDWTELGDAGISLDITRLLNYVDLPEPFKRYIVYKASTRAATQLVGNPQLARLLAQQEALSRATCMEYECNQGNHSMFGFPADTVYHTYRPWRNLKR